MLGKKLKWIKKVFDNAHVEFWLSGGQVLGLIREGGFLYNDHDIDLGMHEKDLWRALEALKKEKTEYEIRKINNMTPRALKISGGIDVFIFHIRGNEAYAVTHCEGFGYAYHMYPKTLFESFQEIEFQGEKYRVPNPPERYLELEYGDWKTKKDRWNCCDHPPCVRKKL